MPEEQIAAELKKNIPAPYETTLPPKAPISTDEASSTVTEAGLDDVLYYKLSRNLLGDYQPQDKESREQIGFIWTTISQSMGTDDYGLVTSRISELQRMLGVNYTHPADNLFHLWKWLKLDRQRVSIEAEMGTLRG